MTEPPCRYSHPVRRVNGKRHCATCAGDAQRRWRRGRSRALAAPLRLCSRGHELASAADVRVLTDGPVCARCREDANAEKAAIDRERGATVRADEAAVEEALSRYRHHAPGRHPARRAA